MALNFADRIVSNNPSAYGIVRAIEVSGHKTVSSLSALYKIPDCILSDSGNNSNNDSLGQTWYVVDQKSIYQLIDWDKRNEEDGWKPYLSGTITEEELGKLLEGKQDKLTPGDGISIEGNVISCTLDTSLFVLVEELPSLDTAKANKIYLLKKKDNSGEAQSYAEYILVITQGEEGEVKEWEKIGEYDLSLELAPYLKIVDAESTYIKKENIIDSFEGGNPKEQVLSAEKGKELKTLIDGKVGSVTATENKGIVVEGTATEPTIGILLDPDSEKFLSIGEKGITLKGVQDAIDAASNKLELESDVVYNINELFPGQGDGEGKNTWTIQWAAAKLDATLEEDKKVAGIKCKFLSTQNKWRTYTYYGGFFLDEANWSYDLVSKDFEDLAIKDLPVATPDSNGVMSKEDKAKLDRISEGVGEGSVVDKITELVGEAKKTIDGYTVNGHKISANPVLTKEDVGLENLTNDAQVKRSEMGVAGGVATLDEDGKILETQLPDSVLGNVKYQGVWDAITNNPKLVLNDLESIGHYYISITKGSQFGFDFDPGDWVINSNGKWVKVDNVDSVKSVNGQIGIVELGIKDIPGLEDALNSMTSGDEFSSHLTNFENPHKVTKEQVGLGNVDNTADLEKPISKATQEALDKKVSLTPDNKIPEENLPIRTLHSMFYKGFWDANENSPILNHGNKGENGDYYIVNVEGKKFDYVFMPGDIIFNADGTWHRLMGSNLRDERIKFEILSFTADRYVFEKGESATIVFNWEYNMQPEGQVNFQVISEFNVPVEDRTYTVKGITQSREFILNSSFRDETDKASLKVEFLSKFYVGTSEKTTVEDADLLKMDSYFIDGKTSSPLKSFDCTGGKYIYVAIPSEDAEKYGVFANGILVTDTVDVTREVVNAHGGSFEYVIMRLANKFNGALNIEVKLINQNI